LAMIDLTYFFIVGVQGVAVKLRPTFFVSHSSTLAPDLKKGETHALKAAGIKTCSASYPCALESSSRRRGAGVFIKEGGCPGSPGTA